MYDESIMKTVRMPFTFNSMSGKKNAILVDFFTANRNVKPIAIANTVRNTLILLCIFSLLYVFLVVSQLPTPQLFDRPAQIYQFQDVRKADKLFGQKDIDLSKIRLTGFMASGATTGFAIFEVDGKTSGAIAIGETFGKGYFLKSVSKESVEIVYQGKPYQILMSTKTNKNTK
jgi:hypothetical protein